MDIEGTAMLPSPAVRRVEKPQIAADFQRQSRCAGARAQSADASGRDENVSRSGMEGPVPLLVLPLSTFAAQFIGQLLCAGRRHPAGAAKSYRETAPIEEPALLRTI